MIFNAPLEIAIIAMLIAQFLKLPIQYLIDRQWTPSIIFSTGGMPSSHSAFVTALTIGVALSEGVTSVYFAISMVLALIVIHDSIGIRREAGKHATVLNQMKQEWADLMHELQRGDNKDIEQVELKLKELLGHEPFEAISGTLLGAVLAVGYYLIWIL